MGMIYKIADYLHMKGVLDSIELWTLKRADYVWESVTSLENPMFTATFETQSVLLEWVMGGHGVCCP